ncbi:MAG: winged helix-turn-helix domain-containing protein [Methanomassiliicoccales archaeon]|nr:winged helix-turn-helix domain-containing protein [Methanomassiliicoccales archaeon]
MDSGPRSISDLVSDEYAGRILSLTFSQPRCVQEICAMTGIPIAVAYRRVAALENAGLIKCHRTEVSQGGKKSKYYRCQVDLVRLTFRKGRFEVEVEWKDSRSERHIPAMVSR